MKKQNFVILIIFVMVISPIVSAFDHCAGMMMSDKMTNSQVTFFDSDQGYSHTSLDQEQPNNQMDIDCKACNGCIIHICHGFGIFPSSPMLNTKTVFSYSNSEYHIPESLAPFPHTRPPITIL